MVVSMCVHTDALIFFLLFFLQLIDFPFSSGGKKRVKAGKSFEHCLVFVFIFFFLLSIELLQ